MNNRDEIDFLNAAGAVYAWMCAADGVVTVEESEGFADYISQSSYVDKVSHDDFVTAYAEIAHAFDVDFEDGYNRALVRIEPLKSNKEAAKNLIKVARDALVADEKLEEVEENVLRELCTILDVKEEEIF